MPSATGTPDQEWLQESFSTLLFVVGIGCGKLYPGDFTLWLKLWTRCSVGIVHRMCTTYLFPESENNTKGLDSPRFPHYAVLYKHSIQLGSKCGLVEDVRRESGLPRGALRIYPR